MTAGAVAAFEFLEALRNAKAVARRAGSRLMFDHQLTRFPLERSHAESTCDRCHLPAKLGRS
ncbi:MAG: hypothetical protein AAFV29_12200, partial [Myxococcota bacterium]